MSLPGRRIALLATLAGCMLGCRGVPKDQAYPPDPLFVIKKPEQVKPENAAPDLLAATTPEVPTVPATVLAARQAPAANPAVPPHGEYRVAYPPASFSP